MTKKSSFPDLKEFMGYAGKLAKDVRKSFGGIIQEYKDQRANTEEEAKEEAEAKPAEPTQESSAKEAEQEKVSEDKAKAKKTKVKEASDDKKD